MSSAAIEGNQMSRLYAASVRYNVVELNLNSLDRVEIPSRLNRMFDQPSEALLNASRRQVRCLLHGHHLKVVLYLH